MKDKLIFVPVDPDANTEFRCKHCKVPVVGRLNFQAILGHEHKRGCPRRRLGK